MADAIVYAVLLIGTVGLVVWILIQALRMVVRVISFLMQVPVAPDDLNTHQGKAGIRLGPARTVRRPTLRGPSNGQAMRRGTRLAVPSRAEPMWRERGWTRKGDTFTGTFAAAGRHYRGQIVLPYRGGLNAYILHAPLKALRKHPHSPCFRECGKPGWTGVHFQTAPRSVDHAISNIERILSEALRGR